jgi:hypothetical protein
VTNTVEISYPWRRQDGARTVFTCPYCKWEAWAVSGLPPGWTSALHANGYGSLEGPVQVAHCSRKCNRAHNRVSLGYDDEGWTREKGYNQHTGGERV